MKKALLLALALLGLPLVGLEAQTSLDLVNEVYEGRDCHRSALMESLSCQYRVGEDLQFEIANVGDPEAFLNVWSAVMVDGDFFIGTTPLHDPGEELFDHYPCIVIKPGTSNPTYRMMIHYVYVSPRTGDVYESEFDCKTDGENGQLESRGTSEVSELDGPYETYFENGQLKSTFTGLGHNTGEYDGLAETYFENGVLESRINYNAGEYDGLAVKYFENGALQFRGTYNMGELDGPAAWYDENGQLEETGTGNMGQKCGEWIEDGEAVTYDPCPSDPEDSP